LLNAFISTPRFAFFLTAVVIEKIFPAEEIQEKK